MKTELPVTGTTKNNDFWIIGAGRFGRLAAARLSAGCPQGTFWVVDNDAAALSRLADLPVNTVQEDGVTFLVNHLTEKDKPSYIVPAVPVHLAYEWLKKKLEPAFTVQAVPVPEKAARDLPHSILTETGKLYASYATFTCPGNCPEPQDICTVTGKKREGLLYRDFQELKVEGFVTINIRSLQLAPGVGGFKPEVLWSALEKVGQAGPERFFLLGTACLCHGVMDAFRLEVIPGRKNEAG